MLLGLLHRTVGHRGGTGKLVLETILPFLHFFEPDTELVDLVHQVAHRARDWIGEPRVIELGVIGASARALDDLAGDADDRRIRRRRRNHYGASADPAATADRHRTDNRGTRTDHHVVFERRVALFLLEAGAAERDALVEQHVVADLCGLADDDAHAVIDKEATPNLGARMDFDAGDPAG